MNFLVFDDYQYFYNFLVRNQDNQEVILHEIFPSGQPIHLFYDMEWMDNMVDTVTAHDRFLQYLTLYQQYLCEVYQEEYDLSFTCVVALNATRSTIF